jgi:hypothetical protein
MKLYLIIAVAFFLIIPLVIAPSEDIWYYTWDKPAGYSMFGKPGPEILSTPAFEVGMEVALDDIVDVLMEMSQQGPMAPVALTWDAEYNNYILDTPGFVGTPLQDDMASWYHTEVAGTYTILVRGRFSNTAEVDINRGWTQINFPVEGGLYAQDVLNQINSQLSGPRPMPPATAIYQFVDGAWGIHTNLAPDYNNFAITAGTGYFIQSTAEGIVTITANPPE